MDYSGSCRRIRTRAYGSYFDGKHRRPAPANRRERVGLGDAVDTLAADLSYGRKRVLEIATTLALDPKVLLLDEPMAGMGHEDVGTVSNIIRDVAREHAVLMVEHNLKVVADLCDTVTVLQRGEILAAGDYVTVSNDERVRTAYMGTDA